MKRFFNFSLIVVLAVVFLASCTKNDYYNNSYAEQATVYKHDYSPWIILSFANGDFAVMKALEADKNYWPETYDVLRGNFDKTGSRSFRNVTMNYTFNGLIAEFQTNVNDALDAWDYYASKDGYPPASSVSRTKSFTPMARTAKDAILK